MALDRLPVQHPARGEFTQVLQCQVLCHAQFAHYPGVPVLGDTAHPGGGELGWYRAGHILPADEDAATAGPTHPAKGLGQFLLPVAAHPRDAQDLSGVHCQGDLLERRQSLVVGHAQPLDLQDGFGPRLFLLAADAKGLAADHHPGQFPLRRLRGVHCANDFAVAQDSDPVADGHHLVQFMGDKDDREPAFPQPLQRVEECLYLLGDEDCRRFVQDEHARFAVECFQDLHPLLLADGEVAHLGGGANLQPEASC